MRLLIFVYDIAVVAYLAYLASTQGGIPIVILGVLTASVTIFEWNLCKSTRVMMDRGKYLTT